MYTNPDSEAVPEGDQAQQAVVSAQEEMDQEMACEDDLALEIQSNEDDLIKVVTPQEQREEAEDS